MYQGYAPRLSPTVPDQIKPIADQLYRRIDSSNAPVDIFKNALINGSFDFWQRGTSFGANVYNADRFSFQNPGANGTLSATQQALAFGDVSSESTLFGRYTCTGNTGVADGAVVIQPIEGVRRFNGKRVVIRGMVRRSSGAGNVAVELAQSFGTGGSSISYTYAGVIAPSALWTPFSLIVQVPSVAGKTIVNGNDYLSLNLWLSAGSNYNARTNNLGLQTIGVDFADLEVKEVMPGFGDQFPSYERVLRDIDFLRALRFYETVYTDLLFYSSVAGVLGSTSIYHRVPKRVSPSIAFNNTYNGNGSSITLRALDLSSTQLYAAAAAAGQVEVAGNYTASAEF